MKQSENGARECHDRDDFSQIFVSGAMADPEPSRTAADDLLALDEETERLQAEKSHLVNVNQASLALSYLIVKWARALVAE